MPVSIKITLRLPFAVYRAVNKAAQESGRSLNTEITERLNQSLGNPYLSEKKLDDDVMIRITDLEMRVAEIEKWQPVPGRKGIFVKKPNKTS